MTINERLKFLIKELGMSARAFSTKLGVPDTTTRNYLDKDTKLNSEYLERIFHHFKEVNLIWLVTGEGNPLIPPTNGNAQASANAEKFFRSPVVGTSHGPAYQENNATASPDVEAIKNKLALAEQEVENLKTQLAITNALLASKEEMLALLRITYNRPN